MQCPYCSEDDSRVLDSRASADAVRRRRQCAACGRRFTTYERVDSPEIRVHKRGGHSEAFDREKLLRVVKKVTRGRPVAAQAIQDLVRGLEAELLDAGVAAITAGELTGRLLARLEALDAIAARRYAVNYQREDGTIHTEQTEKPSPQLALPIAGAPAPEPEPEPAVEKRRRKKP